MPELSSHSRTASLFFRELQDEICAALAAVDGKAGFLEDAWEREGGGGGRTRVLAEGAVFEKAGVNFSAVFGRMSEEFARQVPGEGLDFSATGISLVLHPRSPMIPTVHANFRFLTKGAKEWFGGGADLTPYYPCREDVITGAKRAASAASFSITWKETGKRASPLFATAASRF
jgi:coproporphyrinogen III oxidase